MFIIPVIALAAFSCAAAAQTGSAGLKSPDGRLEISFHTVANGRVSASGGQLVYEVSYQDKTVISRSKLGLELQGQAVLGENVRIVSLRQDSIEEVYKVVHGKSNPVRNHYNSLQIELVESGSGPRTLFVEARAYDDGVAFRYVVPEQANAGDFRLTEEKTEFRIPKDCPAYPMFLRGFDNNYEDEHVMLPVSGITSDRLIGLPLLVEVPGVAWVAITEAHLEDYAGMYLRRNVEGARTGLQAVLAPRPDESGLKVMARTPHASPWRVIMTAPEVGRLIESNIVINLNPPLALKDTSWIKPGKSAWDWWYGRVKIEKGFLSQMDTRTMKYLTDFAANAGLEYLLIDAGWSDRLDIRKPSAAMDMPEIFRYAKEKGVGIWLWLHWTGVDKHMDEAFPIYEKWGAVGVKIDFMDRDDQWMVNWYRRVVKKAAEHHLMVDFHGAYKPAGMRRTYPNLMTREGVQGQECSKWSFAIEPEHNLILPFTRMLAGPMDFTPGGFDNVTKAEFVARRDDPMVMGTRAHNVAMFVVYESPYMVVCDHPSAYEGQPAFEYIKKVPASWDETRVINARVGDYITVARRRGKEWYVGSMTDWSPRELDIPLSFLGEGEFTAEIYADAADAERNPKNVVVTKKQVNRGTVLKVKLAAGGGNAIRIHE